MTEITMNLLKCFLDILLLGDDIEYPQGQGNRFNLIINQVFMKIWNINYMQCYSMLYNSNVQAIMRNYENQFKFRSFDYNRFSLLLLAILEVKIDEYLSINKIEEETLICDIVVNIKECLKNNSWAEPFNFQKLDNKRAYRTFHYPDRGKINNIVYLREKFLTMELRDFIVNYNFTIVMDNFDYAKRKIYSALNDKIDIGLFCFPSVSMSTYIAHEMILELELYRFLDIEIYVLKEIEFLEYFVIEESMKNIIKTGRINEFLERHNGSHSEKIDTQMFNEYFKLISKGNSPDSITIISVEDIKDYYPYIFIDWPEYWKKLVNKNFGKSL